MQKKNTRKQSTRTCTQTILAPGGLVITSDNTGGGSEPPHASHKRDLTHVWLIFLRFRSSARTPPPAGPARPSGVPLQGGTKAVAHLLATTWNAFISLYLELAPGCPLLGAGSR